MVLTSPEMLIAGVCGVTTRGGVVTVKECVAVSTDAPSCNSVAVTIPPPVVHARSVRVEVCDVSPAGTVASSCRSVHPPSKPRLLLLVDTWML